MIDFKKLDKIQNLIQYKVQENKDWLSYSFEYNQFSHNIVIRLCNKKTGATHMSAYDIEDLLEIPLEYISEHLDNLLDELKNK